MNGGVHSASLHSLARSNQRIAFQGPMAAKWTRVHIPSPLLFLLLVPTILNVLKGAVQQLPSSLRVCAAAAAAAAVGGEGGRGNLQMLVTIGKKTGRVKCCSTCDLPLPPSLPPSFPLINIERIKSKVISRHTHGNHRRPQDNSRQVPTPCRAFAYCSPFYYSSL